MGGPLSCPHFAHSLYAVWDRDDRYREEVRCTRFELSGDELVKKATRSQNKPIEVRPDDLTRAL